MYVIRCAGTGILKLQVSDALAFDILNTTKFEATVKNYTDGTSKNAFVFKENYAIPVPGGNMRAMIWVDDYMAKE